MNPTGTRPPSVLDGETPARPPFTLRRAYLHDLNDVLTLLGNSARWMHNLGYTAWPYDGFPESRIRPGVENGTVWLLTAKDRPIGTLALDQDPDPEFLAPETEVTELPGIIRSGRAWIGHRMATDRNLTLSGLGKLLVMWSIDWTHRQGGEWRLTNVNRAADALQRWYHQELGFERVVIVRSTNRQSGYLMSRQVEPVPGVHAWLSEQD